MSTNNSKAKGKRRGLTGKTIHGGKTAIILRILCAGFVLATAAVLSSIHFNGVEVSEQDGFCFRYVDKQTARTAAIQIDPQPVDGKMVLFLPSNADYSKLPLYVSHRATVSGAGSNKTNRLRKNRINKVDITKIYGGMSPGEEYVLHIASEFGDVDVVLIRSACVPSIHLEIDKDLSALNEDKSLRSAGRLILVDDHTALSGSLKWIRGRGNTSWDFASDKKPYVFCLDEKMELIEGAGKSKKWCLLANAQHDLSSLQNTFALKLYEAVDGDSALSARNIDLYVNGEYRGAYLLTEKVEVSEEVVDIRPSVVQSSDNSAVRTRVVRDGGVVVSPYKWNELPEESDSVVVLTGTEDDPAIASGIQAYQYTKNAKLDSSGGFLLEVDSYYYTEPSWFVTSRGVGITVKSPENATEEQMRTVAAFVQEFENALFSPSGFNARGAYYDSYVDIDSLMSFFLYECFIQDADAFISSTFFYIDSDESGRLTTMKWGPAWDFDVTTIDRKVLLPYLCGASASYSEAAQQSIWMEQLMQRGDFVSGIYQKNGEAFSLVVKNHALEILEQSMEELRYTWTLNNLRWETQYSDENNAHYASIVQDRILSWEKIWKENHLLGITLGLGNRFLEADVNGSWTRLEWYKVAPDGSLSLVLCTEERFAPSESGTYLVCASGPNMAYCDYIAEDDGVKALYTVSDKPALAAEKEIRMYSNPMFWDEQPQLPILEWTPGYYSFSTGELIEEDVETYHSSTRLFPQSAEPCLGGWNYQSGTSYMSLFLKGEYVGARYQDEYYAPGNVHVSDNLDYDEFALSIYDADVTVQNCTFSSDAALLRDLDEISKAGQKYVELQVGTTQELLDAVNEARFSESDSVVYSIVVAPGKYELWDALDKNVIGGNGDTIWCRGLELPDHCNLRGVGEVVISCTIPESANSAAHPYSGIVSVLNLHNTNNTIRNIHFVGNNTRYCVHNDSGFGNNHNQIVFENCRFTHNGTESETYWVYTPRCYGAGLLTGCRNLFRRCVFDGAGNADNLLYVHTHYGENNTETVFCRIENCTFLTKDRVVIEIDAPWDTEYGAVAEVYHCWFSKDDSIVLDGVGPVSLYKYENSDVAVIDKTSGALKK